MVEAEEATRSKGQREGGPVCGEGFLEEVGLNQFGRREGTSEVTA